MFENFMQYDRDAVWAMTLVFTKEIQKKSYLGRKCFYMGAGLWGTVCGLLLLAVFSRLETAERALCIAALVVCVPSLLKGLFLRRFMAWSSRRVLRRSGEALERHFTFSEESCLCNRPGMETVYQYETVRNVYETETHFMLQLDKRSGIIVDKNGFSHGTPEGFRDFLERKLKKPVLLVD